MKKLSRRDCNYWSKRIDSIIYAMRKAYNEGVENRIDLNKGIIPLNSNFLKYGEFIEIINIKDKYAKALINHPQRKSCKIGRLDTIIESGQYYFVKMKADVPLSDHFDNMWVPTDFNAIRQISEQMNIDKNSFLCDIGGGDGRVGYLLPCKSVCVEKNSYLVKVANEWAPWFNKTDIEILNEDFYNHDLSKYTHIFASLSQHPIMELSAKLFGEVSSNTRIFTGSNSLDPEYFKVEKIFPYVFNDSQRIALNLSFVQKKR